MSIPWSPVSSHRPAQVTAGLPRKQDGTLDPGRAAQDSPAQSLKSSPLPGSSQL